MGSVSRPSDVESRESSLHNREKKLIMKRVKKQKAKSSLHQNDTQTISAVSMSSCDQFPFGSTMQTLNGDSFKLLRQRKSIERTTPMQVKITKLDLKSIIKKKKKSATHKTKKKKVMVEVTGSNFGLKSDALNSQRPTMRGSLLKSPTESRKHKLLGSSTSTRKPTRGLTRKNKLGELKTSLD